MKYTEFFLSRREHDALLAALPQLLEKAFYYSGHGGSGTRWSLAGVFLSTVKMPAEFKARLTDARAAARLTLEAAK